MDINLIGNTLDALPSVVFRTTDRLRAFERKYVGYDDALLAFRTLFSRQETEHREEMEKLRTATNSVSNPKKKIAQNLSPFFEVGTLVSSDDGVRVVLERDERISRVSARPYYMYRIGTRTNTEGKWVFAGYLTQYMGD